MTFQRSPFRAERVEKRRAAKKAARRKLLVGPVIAAAYRMTAEKVDTRPVLRGAQSRAQFNAMPRTVFSPAAMRMVKVWRGYAVHQGAKECARRRSARTIERIMEIL